MTSQAGALPLLSICRAARGNNDLMYCCIKYRLSYSCTLELESTIRVAVSYLSPAAALSLAKRERVGCTELTPKARDSSSTVVIPLRRSMLSTACVKFLPMTTSLTYPLKAKHRGVRCVCVSVCPYCPTGRRESRPAETNYRRF